MKKAFLLLILAASVTFSFAQHVEHSTIAQQKQFAKPAVKKQSKINPQATSVVKFDAKHNAIVNPLLLKDAKQALAGKRFRHNIPVVTQTDTLIAGYARPEGSLYLGFDKLGYGLHFNYPTLVGSWLNGVDAWTYYNTSYSNSPLTYTWDTYWNDAAQYYEEQIANSTSIAESDKEGYRKHYHTYARIGGKQQIVDDNFVDSIPAQEFTPWGYGYTTLRPVLIASDGTLADTFAINMFYPQGEDLYETTIDPETGTSVDVMVEDPETGEQVHKLKTVYDVMLENGSITSGDINPFEILDADGFWPLTALPAFYLFDEYNSSFEPNTYSNYGMYQFTSADRSTWGYNYGSNEQLYYKFDNLGQYAGIDSIKPEIIVVAFDKPMSPLYVHDITLPIFAFDEEGKLTKPVFNQINIDIFDSEFNVLTSTSATLADTTTSRFGGQMLHFAIKETDDYGEILSEGITLSDEFYVRITGHTEEGNNVGILSGYEPYELLGVTQIFTSGDETSYCLNDWSPMVILNGNFMTLQSTEESLENGQLDEVVEIEMVQESDGYYYGYALNPEYPANSNYKYTLPGFFASYIPVDTLANNAYTYDISMPENYDIDFEIDNEGYVFWNDYHYANVYIVSLNGQFQAGDEIKISKYGRSITFRVINSSEGSAIKNVSESGNARVDQYNGNFRLTYTNDFDRVEMIAANGQVVAKHNLPQGGNYLINAEAMPNGVYMFRLSGKNATEILRAVK